MGINLDFVEKEGPKIFNPVRTLADIDALITPPPEENVGYTLEAIKLVPESDPSRCSAPWIFRRTFYSFKLSRRRK